jgi:endonuclease/exonuclease/phosphatase family metal-dependent hydrolase
LNGIPETHPLYMTPEDTTLTLQRGGAHKYTLGIGRFPVEPGVLPRPCLGRQTTQPASRGSMLHNLVNRPVTVQPEFLKLDIPTVFTTNNAVKLRKRLFITALILILTLFIGSMRWSVSPSVLPASSPSTLPASFRVASWNIHGAADASLDRISSYLKDFDLVALNEVHANFTPQSQTLANLLGNHSTFSPSEWRWFHPHLGNALLHKPGRLEADINPLPSSSGRGKRSFMVARFKTSKNPLYVVITHIDRETDRNLQIQIIADLFAELPTPSILMGDFNSEPNDDALKPLYQIPGLIDVVKTSLPDKDPKDRIDYIFARGLACPSAGITPNNASDHPLVWANLTIPE